MKTRNSMIVSPHPRTQKSSYLTVEYGREALKKSGAPVGLLQCIKIWHYLTDSNAWFLLGEQDSKFGLIHFIRKPVTFAKDSDCTTGDALFKGSFRDSTEVNSAMSLYGNAGSS